jgi:2-C-methyl-D-erythritol 2,4-cyclodiphosphate synthase
LGGITIPYKKGLLGHSDADAVCHAIMDALLGAMALGNIGTHFSDKDPKYKGISSIKLLEHVQKLVIKNKYKISNIDSTIICQEPKLNPYIPKMCEKIAKTLKIYPTSGKVLVEGVNAKIKHVKAASDDKSKAGRVEVIRTIDISNVMFFDEVKNKGVRLGMIKRVAKKEVKKETKKTEVKKEEVKKVAKSTKTK